MPELKVQGSQVDLGSGLSVTVVQIAGFVDAQNYGAFQDALGAVSGKRHPLVILDFEKVDYVNSSGIGLVIKHHQVCKENGGELVLAGVSKPVGLTMHMLGVSSFVPFLESREAAKEYFKKAFEQASGQEGRFYDYLRQKVGAAEGQQLKYKLPLREEGPKKTGRASILMVVPKSDYFVEIMKFRLHDHADPTGRFNIVTDCAEALRVFDDVNPDLVVLDDGVPGAEDFLFAVKIQKGRSLTSILKIYGRVRDIEAAKDFKIWENDYLVEPFDVMALFTLSEAELQRVPADRRELLQQVHFQFRTTDRNIDKANDLAHSLIDQIGMREDDRVALFAAFKEGVDNGAYHGNRNDPSLTIDVHFIVSKEKVTVYVQDEGEGFDYLSHLSGKDGAQAFQEAKERIINQGQRGGLGVLLMKKCVDKLEYEGKGNTLRF